MEPNPPDADSQESPESESASQENPDQESPGQKDPDPTRTNELAPPPLSDPDLSEIGKDRPSAGDRSDSGSDGAETSEALEDPERLRELQESLGRLEGFAAQAQAENTVRAYASDLEDFRHWCGRYDREWLPATPKTIGLYLGARADELSLATLERRLAAIQTSRLASRSCVSTRGACGSKNCSEIGKRSGSTCIKLGFTNRKRSRD